MWGFGRISPLLMHYGTRTRILSPCAAATLAASIASAARCEDEESIASTPSLIDQADAILKEGQVVRTPIQFEDLKNTLNKGSVNTFDGFRVIVQKQLNLNTVVSHFFWLGSQQTQSPTLYQYRLILPFDDRIINVATDANFNIEGEIKTPLTKSVSAKSNFQVGEHSNMINVDIDWSGTSHTAQAQFLKQSAASSALMLSYMQALTPSLSVGGMAQYQTDKGTLTTAYGGVYDKGENLLAAQWDTNLKLMYHRRVNPNRVHLTSELVVDEGNNTSASLGAQYMLKQSSLSMSIDNNLLIKSSLESQVLPGISMQFSAEMAQQKDHYRFGYSVVIS